ncbi:hypothetical protein GCM10007426_34150 [Alloalcanivorax dieselolei]|uniref:hypothetical protein n=1 Tax=Alloalcanivorax dieselolei TaxID=285091 RepID=UPI00166A9401|nr:hypothetical protein [Alloalcanivorax dieselolei]GGK02248.1 hypothetical protein GCM10007426_34150 [Alloalcanivorax dieselolei]
MAKAISGLAKAAQDPQSGAESGYWVLTQYTVKLLQGKTQAVLRGFASAEAAEQGLRAYANLVVEVEGAPAGDAPQWIYQNLIDSESSPLAGAPPPDKPSSPCPPARLVGAFLYLEHPWR